MAFILKYDLKMISHKLNLLVLKFSTQEFEGNTDQYMVVSHLLKKPIVTRYIRIIPVSWQGAIALRTDFYGCKSGEYLV